MYIACPKCNSSFVVKPEQIGKKGKKVKCSKCLHVWLQALPKEQGKKVVIKTPSEVKPLPRNSNLPAIIPEKKSSFKFLSALTLIALMVFMGFNLVPDEIKSRFNISSDELVIQDVKIKSPEDDKTLIVSYKIFNNSNKSKNMPLVRIRVLDKDKKVIKSAVEDQRKLLILPNKFIEVQTEFNPTPEGAVSANIIIGNKIDFLLN